MRFLTLSVTPAIALWTSIVSGAAAEPGFYSPTEKVEGKSYSEWTVAWWQWVCAVPKDRNPLLDTKGVHAGSGQSGPVFFLAGTFKNEAMKRTCEVPAGKPILVPLLNMLANDALNIWKDDQLVTQAKDAIDTAHELKLSVDGRDMERLDGFRIRSAVFVFAGPDKANDSVHPAIFGKQRAVSDGYWVILKPLAVGEHTIVFGGKMKKPEFTSDLSYTIKVVAGKR